MSGLTLYATCRDSSGRSRKLTQDKTYRVLDLGWYGPDGWVVIKNDLGDPEKLNMNRFEVTKK